MQNAKSKNSFKFAMQFSVQFSGFPKSGIYDTFWDEKENEINQP